MADDDKGRARFLQEALGAIEKASEAGSAGAQLDEMIDRMITIGASVKSSPDKAYAGLIDSLFEALFVLRMARQAVDYVATERFNEDRSMADTRLNAIIELTKVILSNWKK